MVCTGPICPFVHFSPAETGLVPPSRPSPPPTPTLKSVKGGRGLKLAHETRVGVRFGHLSRSRPRRNAKKRENFFIEQLTFS